MGRSYLGKKNKKRIITLDKDLHLNSALLSKGNNDRKCTNTIVVSNESNCSKNLITPKTLVKEPLKFQKKPVKLNFSLNEKQSVIFKKKLYVLQKIASSSDKDLKKLGQQKVLLPKAVATNLKTLSVLPLDNSKIMGQQNIIKKPGSTIQGLNSIKLSPGFSMQRMISEKALPTNLVKINEIEKVNGLNKLARNSKVFIFSEKQCESLASEEKIKLQNIKKINEKIYKNLNQLNDHSYCLPPQFRPLDIKKILNDRLLQSQCSKTYPQNYPLKVLRTTPTLEKITRFEPVVPVALSFSEFNTSFSAGPPNDSTVSDSEKLILGI